MAIRDDSGPLIDAPPPKNVNVSPRRPRSTNKDGKDEIKSDLKNLINKCLDEEEFRLAEELTNELSWFSGCGNSRPTA